MEVHMAKALLFDLDGTLLPMNTDQFIEQYMRALAPNVASFLDPKAFIKIIWESTNDMIKNTDHNLTNEQVFIDSFVKRTGIQQSDIWPTFVRFYEEEFPLLKIHTNPSPLSKEIVEIAKEQGRKVVIATNPVFPKAAIYERLKWLDLLDFPFDLVTVYEESHFCKPQPKY